MPKQKRWSIKRTCDFIYKDIERALANCKKLTDLYCPDYPEQCERVQSWAIILIAIQEAVSKFREEV